MGMERWGFLFSVVSSPIVYFFKTTRAVCPNINPIMLCVPRLWRQLCGVLLKTILYKLGCLDWYWCILLGYTRCCDVFFMVSNARGTGTWTNVKFTPTRDLNRVKCPGVARGGGGGDGHSWIWLIHNSLRLHHGQSVSFIKIHNATSCYQT